MKKTFENKISFLTVFIRTLLCIRIYILYIYHQFKWRWTVSNTSSKKTLFTSSSFLFVFRTLCRLLVYMTRKVRLTFILLSNSARLHSIQAREITIKIKDSNTIIITVVVWDLFFLLMLVQYLIYSKLIVTTTIVMIMLHSRSVVRVFEE